MIACTIFLFGVIGCAATEPARPVHGPDKQFSSGLQGAATGAGAGAVTGFQLGSAAGPAAFMGAGIGAVAGGIQGLAEDNADEQMMDLAARTRQEREVAQVHELLHDHYKRRTEIHPTRDIFPADLFFSADSDKVNTVGVRLVRELTELNRNRMPWSRLVIATYVKSENDESEWAQELAKGRAVALGNLFTRFGINPRRIETRPVLVRAPVVDDPRDRPGRYSQAVELIVRDR